MSTAADVLQYLARVLGEGHDAGITYDVRGDGPVVHVQGGSVTGHSTATPTDLMEWRRWRKRVLLHEDLEPGRVGSLWLVGTGHVLGRSRRLFAPLVTRTVDQRGFPGGGPGRDVVPRTCAGTRCRSAAGHAALRTCRARRAVVTGDPRQLRHVSFVADAEVDDALAATGLSDLADRLDVRRVSAFDAAAAVAPVRWLDEHVRRSGRCTSSRGPNATRSSCRWA